MVAFPKVYVTNIGNPTLFCFLLQPWLDGHVPKNLYNEQREPHSVASYMTMGGWMGGWSRS